MRYTANISDLTLNILTDKINFEDIEKYKYDKSYLNVVKPLLEDWNIYKDRVFFQCQPKDNVPLIKSGWKIHVSSIPDNSEEILRIVAKICKENETAFKFILDSKLRDMSCGKNWSRSSAGKFITIYPKSIKSFEFIIEELYKNLKSFVGPYILTDKRYKDCKVLYYRYGTILPDIMRYADGREYHLFDSPSGTKEVDQRQPYYYKPSWVNKPSFETETEDKVQELSLKEGRYQIKNVISFSSTGGVYIAKDIISNNKVVIKEARPYTLTSIFNQNDSISNLKREYDNLISLKDLKCIPNPIDFFKEWEHTFMVQEYVNYDSLSEFSASKSIVLNPRPSKKDISNFNKLIEKIFLNISYAIKSIHELGYAINDLSPNNIMIDKHTLDIKIIDLEGMTTANSQNTYIMTTPGYTPKNNVNNTDPLLNDLYSLGAVMFDIIFSGAIFKNLNDKFYELIINRVNKTYHISNKVCFLILKLTNNLHEIKTIDEVIKILKDNNYVSHELSILNQADIYEFRNRLLNKLKNQLNNMKLIDFLPPLRQNDYNIEHGYFGIYHIINYCSDYSLNSKIIEKEVNLNNLNKKVKLPGLYNGKSGIAWVLLELGFEEEAISMLHIAYKESKNIKNYSLYCGLSGIALSHLYFYLKLKDESYLNKSIKLAEKILNNSYENNKGLYWKDEDMNQQKGYLEGATGIALLFIYLFRITNNSEYLDIAKKCLNQELSFVKSYFNNIKSLTFSDEENVIKVSPYLESGSAGVVLVLLRLLEYDKFCEGIYKKYYDELILDCQRIYTAYPTFFDGLSGLGNIMLDCYNFTSDSKYKKIAFEIADTIQCYELNINKEESCMPGMHLLRTSNDFATGTSGVLGFIERLINDKHDFAFTLDHLLSKK